MELLISLLTAVANLLLGLFTYFKNPKSTTHRLLAFLTLQISIWAILNYLSLHQSTEVATLFWIRVDMLPGAPMAPTIYLLVRSFPRRKLFASKPVLAGLFGLIVLTMILTMSPYMFVAAIFENGNIRAIPGPGIILFAVNFLGLLTLSFMHLVRRYKSSTGLEHAQLKYLLFGLITTFLLIAVTDFLGVVLFHSSMFVPLGPLYTLILVGSISYAIVKHRFLDIRLVVARTVTYAMLVIILGTVYALGLFISGTYFFGRDAPRVEVVVSTFLALIMAFTFQPLRRFLERTTNHIFYKAGYDTNAALSELSTVMASTFRLDELTHEILTILRRTLRTSKAGFVLLEGNRIVDMKHEGFSSPPTLDEREIKILSLTPDTLVADELEESRVKNILGKLDISIVAHLRTEGEQAGLLMLGAKESGDIYSGQDLGLIEILAPEAAIAIQNAKAYEEIRRFNITLQEEVDQATADLQIVNKKLVQLDKMKDEFVSLASHELRTPMTAIKSYTWMVLNNKAGDLTPKGREYLDVVYQSTERLIRLVNEMLDISRIESGRIQMKTESFDLVKLLAELKEEFAARVAEKKLALDLVCTATEISMTGDRGKILQIVENLVGNATKFTPAGGRITVTATKTDQQVTIAIADTGRGIKPEDLDKLFQKFSRLEQGSLTSIAESGTGLGLYLSKQYAQLHGGDITVASQVGKGSVFTVVLPLKYHGGVPETAKNFTTDSSESTLGTRKKG